MRVDIGSGLTEQSQLLYSVNSNEQAWGFPSASAEYGSQQSPYQPFTILPAPVSQFDPAASGVPLQNIPVDFDLVPVLDQHVLASESSVPFLDFFDAVNQRFWEPEVNYFPGHLEARLIIPINCRYRYWVTLLGSSKGSDHPISLTSIQQASQKTANTTHMRTNLHCRP